MLDVEHADDRSLGPTAGRITIVTFNILMDFVGHPLVPEWDRRKEACLEALRSADADAIGLQETSPSQLRFLSAGLPEFELWTHQIQLPADFLAKVRARFGADVPAEFAEVALLTRRETWTSMVTITGGSLRLRIRSSRPASGTSHRGLPYERARGTDQPGYR